MARRIITPKGKAVRLENLPELVAKIEAILDRATAREVKQIHMTAALVLRDEARDLAPTIQQPKKNPKPWQVAGMLKSAIFAAYGRNTEPNVLVGVNYKIAPQAHWIEFGTARAQAQPYMRPAITSARAMCVSIIAEGYRKLLVENV